MYSPTAAPRPGASSLPGGVFAGLQGLQGLKPGSTKQRVRSSMDEIAIRGRELEGRGDAAVETATNAYEGLDPEMYLGEQGLRDRFEAARPAFDASVQSIASRNARRGIRGPVAGAIEGDLASAYQRQLLSQVAEAGMQRAQIALGRAEGLRDLSDSGREEAFATRGQGLELLLGERDVEQAERNARRQERASLIGAGLGAAGSIAGLF